MFSRPRLPTSSRIALHISSLLHACSAEPFCTRAAGRVSRSRLSTSSSPLLHSTILLISTRSSCASVAWWSTVYGVAVLVIHFEARKVVQWVLAHWFVLSGIHSLEPTKTGQATLGVSVARLVLWINFHFISRGGAGSDSSGIQSSHFQTSRLQRSFERASRPPAVVDSLAALAFNEAALRLPAVVDSPAAQAFNKAWRRACGSVGPHLDALPERVQTSMAHSADAARSTESRGWIDDPLPAALQGMRERYDGQSGTLSARAPRRSVQGLVQRLREVHPLGLGGSRPSA